VATIGLDDIRASIEQKYQPLVVDLGEHGQVTLVQAMRLPKEKRAEIASIQDRINGSEGDEDAAAEAMRDLIRTVATGPVEQLLETAGEDIAFLMEVITQYMAVSRAGEAAPDENHPS
jgi:hypothetical protein